MKDFKTKYGAWSIVAGASEGLGAAFAEALAKRGINLILLARRLDKLETLSAKLKDIYKIDIKYFSVDLADFAQTKLLLSQINEDIGLLIYNAAYSPIGYFEDIAEDDLAKIVDVNVKTPLLLTKLVSSKMIKNQKGGIILMSSLAGLQGSPKIASYAASKAFNLILSEGIWHELKKHGIDVLASVAGAIRTPGYNNASSSKDAPGTLASEAVAEKTLNSLGKGPSMVPGFTNKLARLFMTRILTRKISVSIMANNTKNLS